MVSISKQKLSDFTEDSRFRGIVAITFRVMGRRVAAQAVSVKRHIPAPSCGA